MANHPIDDIRNVALVGHGASGKTTLADLLLFKAGKTKRVGSVDEGTSLLDTEDDEKERQHSLTSTVCYIDHHKHHVNVIDCPGYPDFIGQVFGSLRAVETAVIVINASSGVEIGARKAAQRAAKVGLSRMIVLNKLDADNINFEQLVAEIKATFGSACALVNVPVGLGADFSGVVSCINVPDEIPMGCVIDPNDASQHAVDAAVETDEQLMERYLEGEKLSPEELADAIESAVAARTLIPIFCTSAKSDIGITELMDGLADYAPPPNEVTRQAVGADGELFDIEPKPDGPLIAQVFKTRIDPFVAKMSYIRIYSGTMKKESSVHVERLGKTVKLHQLMEMEGTEHENVDEAGPGNIITVVKMDDMKTGDSLTAGDDGAKMPPIPFPAPMIGLAVEPKSQADQQKISSALHKIEDEDPTFVVTRNAQTKEMVMRGMSELHLQLVENKLKHRDKVEIITHQPKVPYRETVTNDAEGSYRHKKQSGGSGQFAEVHFRVSSCPQGIDPDEYFTKDRFASMRDFHYDPELNCCFVDRVTGGSVPNQFIPAVEKGVRERIDQGVIAGYQVQDIVVELFFGKDHPVDSNETAFKTAASMCLREIFKQAKPSLLEPIVNIEITVPSGKLGDVTSDLNTRRGRMEGMDGAPGGFQVLHAKAPLAEVMTYARNLSSMTGGQGSFTLEFSHYETVPGNEQQKIIAAAKKEEDEH